MRSESFELKTMQHPAALHACSSAVFCVSLKTIRAPSVAVSDGGGTLLLNRSGRVEGRRESEELTRAGISSILATENTEDTEKSNKALCTLWLKNHINYIFQQPCPPPASQSNRTQAVGSSNVITLMKVPTRDMGRRRAILEPKYEFIRRCINKINSS